jgi:site-specific recombinase XerD
LKTVQVQTAIEDYLLNSIGQTAKTRREKTIKLGVWARLFGETTPLKSVTVSDIRRGVAHLSEHGARGKPLCGHSLHGYVLVLRAWLNWCVKEQLIKESPAAHVALPRSEKRVVKGYSGEDIKILLSGARRSKHPERDVALLSVALDTGLRAQVLLGLKVADIHFESGAFGSWLLVTSGKGRKQRTVPLSNQAALAVRRYLRVRPDIDVPELFLSAYKRPLSKSGLQAVFKRCGGSRISVRNSPQTAPHAFATAHVQARTNLLALPKVLGHASVAMTQRYVEGLSMDASRREAAKVSVLERMTR